MKTRLSVSNFSCIEEAELELQPLTVIIGPQASGKSVLSKLTYFCIDAIRELTFSFFREESLEDHKKKLAEKFIEWFPPTAWGKKSFRIELNIVDFQIIIHRGRPRKDPSSGLEVTYPGFLKEFYDDCLILLHEASSSPVDEVGTTARKNIEARTKISEDFDKQLYRKFGITERFWQTFIPAGRSFFTSQYKTKSVGRADLSDPLLSEFGQIYAYIRDRGFIVGRPRTEEHSPPVVSGPMFRELLGGDIILDKDFPSLAMNDGRLLPFAFMSSGQQELLPLLLTIELFGISPGNLTYIEEPEAHLFPASQSILLKHLLSLVRLKDKAPQLFITTHSPYILARLNNLIKAGLISSIGSSKIKKKVAGVIPENAWITPGSVSAYAIENRKVSSIIDPDGYVDGEYLDYVSNDISRELSALIQIEIDAGISEAADE